MSVGSSEAGQVTEGAAFATPVETIEERDFDEGNLAPGIEAPEHGETRWVFDREGAQENRVEGGERRPRGGNPKSEQQNDHAARTLSSVTKHVPVLEVTSPQSYREKTELRGVSTAEEGKNLTGL